LEDEVEEEEEEEEDEEEDVNDYGITSKKGKDKGN